jgi:hypothetical protein
MKPCKHAPGALSLSTDLRGLSDYLDGQLGDFSCEEIEAHLNGCEPGKKFLRNPAVLRRQLLTIYSRALACGAK